MAGSPAPSAGSLRKHPLPPLAAGSLAAPVCFGKPGQPAAPFCGASCGCFVAAVKGTARWPAAVWGALALGLCRWLLHSSTGRLVVVMAVVVAAGAAGLGVATAGREATQNSAARNDSQTQHGV